MIIKIERKDTKPLYIKCENIELMHPDSYGNGYYIVDNKGNNIAIISTEDFLILEEKLTNKGLII